MLLLLTSGLTKDLRPVARRRRQKRNLFFVFFFFEDCRRRGLKLTSRHFFFILRRQEGCLYLTRRQTDAVLDKELCASFIYIEKWICLLGVSFARQMFTRTAQ